MALTIRNRAAALYPRQAGLFKCDVDAIVELYRDPTTDRKYWERVWCNRPVQSTRKAFDLKLFILSAIVARGGRFFALAFLLRRYGPKLTAFLETRLNWIALGVTARAAAAFIAFEVLR